MTKSVIAVQCDYFLAPFLSRVKNNCNNIWLDQNCKWELHISTLLLIKDEPLLTVNRPQCYHLSRMRTCSLAITIWPLCFSCLCHIRKMKYSLATCYLSHPLRSNVMKRSIIIYFSCQCCHIYSIHLQSMLGIYSIHILSTVLARV